MFAPDLPPADEVGALQKLTVGNRVAARVDELAPGGVDFGVLGDVPFAVFPNDNRDF